MLERAWILALMMDAVLDNDVSGALQDEQEMSSDKVQFTMVDGAIWMPIYTRPLHEFRLAEYFMEHDIPYYLPLVPDVKIHNVYKDHVRHVYRQEVMRPMLRSYIFAQMTREQRRSVWRSNSVNNVWDVAPEEQPRFIEELRGLQMMEALSLTNKVEFKKEIQVNDRFVIESPREFEGTYGYLVEKRKRFWWVVRLEFLGQFIDTQIDPTIYKFRKVES